MTKQILTVVFASLATTVAVEAAVISTSAAVYTSYDPATYAPSNDYHTPVFSTPVLTPVLNDGVNGTWGSWSGNPSNTGPYSGYGTPYTDGITWPSNPNYIDPWLRSGERIAFTWGTSQSIETITFSAVNPDAGFALPTIAYWSGDTILPSSPALLTPTWTVDPLTYWVSNYTYTLPVALNTNAISIAVGSWSGWMVVTEISMTGVAVPEPTSLGLLGLSAGTLLFRRRNG